MAAVEPLSVLELAEYTEWVDRLRDRRASRVIARRIDRVREGNLGDCKWLGGGIGELRVDYGPGYRVYFLKVGRIVIVLLCGGDKSTQVRDMEAAKLLAARAKDLIDGAGN